jgi:hypothetical protein
MKQQISPELEKGLELVDMSEVSGCLRFIEEIDDIDILAKYPSEWFALEQAKKLKATAIYFKRFENRASLPQIYIYDYTRKENEDKELGEIHKNIWNSGVVPLIYVFTKTSIKIIDCSEKPEIDKSEKNYLEYALNSVSEIQQRLKESYSAKLFDNGSFWDKEENKNKFDYKKFAYENLKKSLVELKNNFVTKAKTIGLNEEIAQRLFLQSILIKYLEERSDEHDNRVFPNDYFAKYEDAEDFCDVLKKGKALDLFDELHQHQFNGEIFHWENKNDRELIKKADLSKLAIFLQADEQNKQFLIWRLYDFQYIPIEFISSIYDEFIGDNKKGVVYTPLHLAKFLIDEAMPIDEPKENFRIIDPACGSGIFLVLAYKRLVEWWRIIHNNKELDADTLKQILSENIAGVDISQEAVQLSIFSLSLALCDMLSPRKIWFDLKFDNLAENNIQATDFFIWLKANSENKFDLVIGNPPFKEKLETKAAQLIEQERVKNGLPITPQGQIALLFSEQAINILKPNALLCLLVPASSFLYNKTSLEYRKYFFSKYNVFQVVDFTALSSILFSGANVAVVALFLENKQPDNEDILHLTIKRTKVSKERMYFEIDEYDFHFINKELASNEPLIWKINLFGGGRLYHLISKLKKLSTFGEFLNQKKKDGWFFGEGYIVGHKGDKSEEVLIKSGFKKARYITEKNCLPTDYFTENGIEKIEKEDNYYFRRPRKEFIYKSPHILIKESVAGNRIPVVFLDKDLTFKHEIFGIHAPNENILELKNIELLFKKNNSLYVFYAGCVSSRSGITRSSSTILKNDIMNLPYPEDNLELELLASEKIIRDDVLNYLIEFSSYGETAKVMRQTTIEDLRQFGNVFCDVLNSIYEENNAIFHLIEIIKTKSFICCVFRYGKKTNTNIEPEYSPELEEKIEKLIYNNISESAIYNRIIRIYDNNVIYLIKPNILRYWLGSTALWDADKTLADLIDGGY